MKLKTEERLKLFTANAQIIKKEFTWQNAMTKRLVALLYAQENKSIDCTAIRQCHTLIKNNTGVFSTFRGNMSLYVAALLSLSSHPERLFDGTIMVYDMLKDVKLRASDYLAVAANQIAIMTDSGNYSNVVERTRAFYDGMKAYHRFYTGKDDYIFAAMLGLSDLDVSTSTEHIEQLYNRLKGEFGAKNSVQALAQVLVLGGMTDDEVVNRVFALRDRLKEEKLRLDRSYTTASLGVLALLPADIDSMVNDIDEVQAFLREQKGFGALSVSKQELLLYAAAIVALEYADSIKSDVLTTTLSTSITNIIIAQQTAMIAAASASSAAAASSSSS